MIRFVNVGCSIKVNMKNYYIVWGIVQVETRVWVWGQKNQPYAFEG